MKILIVEDSPVDSLLLRNIVGRGGHDPIVVGSGEEALKELEDRPEIGLVLVDILMPGIDGIHLVELMRENPCLKDVPVIFVSGVSEAETVHRAAALSPDGYVLKPFTEPSKVLSRVDRVARKAAAVILQEDAIGARTGLGSAGVKALLSELSQGCTGVLDAATHPGPEAASTLRGLAHQVGAQRLLAALEEETAGSWGPQGRIHRELRAVLNRVSDSAA